MIEEQLLDGKQNNYLAAVAVVGETFAVAYADVSTSYAAATAIGGEDAYDELLAELARIGPAEIVADVSADLRATIATAIEAIGARLATPSLGLVETRERETFDGFSIDESLAIHRALEALAAFVKRTGVTNGESRPSDPELYRRRQFLSLDPATRKHLELTRAQGQNPRATLLANARRMRDFDGIAHARALDTRVRSSIERPSPIARMRLQRCLKSIPAARRFAKFSRARSTSNGLRRRRVFAGPRRAILARCAERWRYFGHFGKPRRPALVAVARAHR